MKKLFLFGFFICNLTVLIGQEVVFTPTVERHVEKNEYKVSAVFSGLDGAGIAKIKFSIPKNVELSVPPSGALNFAIKGDQLIYYAYSVGSTGELSTTFAISPLDNSTEKELIGVMLQYSKNDDRHDLLFEPIVVSLGLESGSYEEDYSEYKVERDGSLASDNQTDNQDGTDTEENNSFSNKDGASSSSTSTGESSSGSSSSSTSASSSESGSFTVQIFALSNYDESNVRNYCKNHGIKYSDVLTRKVGSVTKVSIGQFSSIEEASKLKRKLIEQHQVEDVFVARLK